MQIQRVNRTQAEKVFISVQNGEGSAISVGHGLRFLGGLAAEVVSTDGVQVIKLDANATMSQFAGIAAADIASLGYGISQVWGYCNSVMLSQEADKTIGVSARNLTFLQKGGGAGTFTSALAEAALTTMAYKYVQNMTTTNISGGIPYGQAFVRGF